MKKILNIISSVKGGDSFSIKLSDTLIEKLLLANPDSTVNTRDLTKNPFPHLEESHLTSFFTPQEMRTDENKEAVKHSEAAIKELMESDIIVIGVPMYNFGITSTLKAWIDHICRAGVTFSYADGAPKGLVINKKVYLTIASGGVYSDGPMKSYDFTESYLTKTLGFLGMTDINVFRVEGTMVPDLKETAWPKAVESVNEYAF
jgi:FMN-dependent NADH-azoreductase